MGTLCRKKICKYFAIGRKIHHTKVEELTNETKLNENKRKERRKRKLGEARRQQQQQQQNRKKIFY